MNEEGGGKDQGITPPTYDQLSFEQRKQWLDYLLAKPLAEAGKPPLAVFDGNKNDDPTRHYTLNPVPGSLNEYSKAYHEVLDSLTTGNRRKIEKAIEKNAFVLDWSIKIHLQPTSEQRLTAIKDLGELLATNEDVRSAFWRIKIRVEDLYRLGASNIGSQAEPFITMYAYSGNAPKLDIAEKALQEKFKYYAPTGLLDWPRFNMTSGGIVFYATGEGFLKARLQRSGMLSRYYGPELNYAFTNEKIKFKS